MNPIDKATNDIDRALTHLRLAIETDTLTPDVANASADKIEKAVEALTGAISAAKAALHAR